MNELERLLRAGVAWPDTPDLEGAVAARIRTGAARRIRLRRPLVIALAALLLMAATAAAIPGIREPVLDWLGLRSVHIERVPRRLPQRAGTARLVPGVPTSLGAARRHLRFIPIVATGLGKPTVTADDFPPGGRLDLDYPGGISVTEYEGRVVTRYLFKFVGPGAQVDPVDVAGERALWIHGEAHQYAYADAKGNVQTDSIQTAGNVLLWRHGNLLVRIEGARFEAQAVRIARSARAAP